MPTGSNKKQSFKQFLENLWYRFLIFLMFLVIAGIIGAGFYLGYLKYGAYYKIINQ